MWGGGLSWILAVDRDGRTLALLRGGGAHLLDFILNGQLDTTEGDFVPVQLQRLH